MLLRSFFVPTWSETVMGWVGVVSCCTHLECDCEGMGGGGLSGREMLLRSAELFLEWDLLH